MEKGAEESNGVRGCYVLGIVMLLEIVSLELHCLGKVQSFRSVFGDGLVVCHDQQC